MTLEELLSLARVIEGDKYSRGPQALDLARWVLDLLAESAPCGLEAPRVHEMIGGGGTVMVPTSWIAFVEPSDARAMARLLIQAADEADAKGKG